MSTPPDPLSPNEPSAGDVDLFGLPRRDPAGLAGSRDVVEIAATTFLEELRAGQRPSVENFARRYPERADEIRKVLPLVATMERWKTNRELLGARQSAAAALEFERLGDCRILREIGRGGMGVVYEAVQESNGRRVAVKVLPWRFPESSQWRQRFHSEARTTARLRHKHIVRVYGYGRQEGWCYYIMHLIEGLPLDRIIRLLKEPAGEVYAADIHRFFAPEGPPGQTAVPGEKGTGAFSATESVHSGATTDAEKVPVPFSARVLRRDSWAQIAKIGMQAATALRYAHRKGTLHRDIKPANLLLDRHGSVWLADFGMASQMDALRPNVTDHFGGTLPYLAPEQIDGRVDERSDVYSLGATLYELCTLTPAFAAATRSQLLDLVYKGLPPPPRAVNRDVPAELERTILKAMAKDPARRFQSAGELLASLRQFKRNTADPSSRGWLGLLFGRP